MYAVADTDVSAMIPETGFLRMLIQYGATQTDAPLIFHVATGLSLLASVLSPDLSYWGAGSPRYPNLYVLTVGLSGSARKTAGMRIGQRILEASVPERIGDTPASHGMLVKQLEEQPQQIIFDEDMARFLRESKGNGYLSSLKQGLMSAYDCGRLSRGSLERGKTEAADPRLSLYWAVNLTEMSEHIDIGDLSSGFLSRFLFFCGTRTRLLPYRSIKQYPERLEALHIQLRRVYELCPRGQVQFSQPAEDILDKWEENIDLRVRTSEDSQEVSLLSRIPDFTRKIAVIFAVDSLIAALPPHVDATLTQGLRLAVQADHAIRAVALAQAAHLSVMAVSHNLFPTQDMRDRDRVLQSIPTGKGVTIGHITRASKLLKGRALMILDTLKEEGLIQPMAITTDRGETMGFVRVKPPEKEKPVVLPVSAAKAYDEAVQASEFRTLPGDYFLTDPEPDPVPDTVFLSDDVYN